MTLLTNTKLPNRKRVTSAAELENGRANARSVHAPELIPGEAKRRGQQPESTTSKLSQVTPAATDRNKKQPGAAAGRNDAICRGDAKPAIGKPVRSKGTDAPVQIIEVIRDFVSTKQERVLTLLNRQEGATIAEIMSATGWQQHSVRGFFAGTVKKKLGFDLVSTQEENGVRRYRIDGKSAKG
jgi:hypothetical protein